jgi:nicotinamide-nucleotide amidase
MIIVTGEELLTGVYADGHTPFLTRTLHPLGLTCVGSISVDDKAPDMHAALTFAAGRAELILVTGGLGPTADDITREVLAEFTGIPLAEDGAVVAELARRFGTSPETLRANVRRQARVPASGTVLANTQGSAVGLVFEKERQTLVALPGPPRELQPMVIEELLPYLSRRYGSPTPGDSRTFRFVGLGQSRIAQVLSEEIPLDNQTHVTSQFQEGRVDFTFMRRGHTPADRAVLDDIERRLRIHLGDYIYGLGTQSLENVIIRRLRARNQCLTLGEVGSGGSLAAALTQAAGADAVLTGIFGAPSLNRLQVLLGGPPPVPVNPNRPLIALLAEQMALRGDRAWGVVVGEVRSEENAPASLQVAVLRPQASVTVHTLPWKDSSPEARPRLVTRLLDLLRRELD